jgi:hypothetical protein
MAMDCPTCGRPNADGKDFCECGEYLRWDPTGVFAVPVPAAGVAATPTPTAPMPVHQTSAPPTPVPAEPVLLTLRLPGAPPGAGPPRLPLAVGTAGMLQGFVRNQTGRVDSYELRIAGLPPDWVEITPPSVDLLPYGSSGQGHESHFHATITPPRAPEARAGVHQFRLEAVSRANGAVTATAPGALEILPYHELTLDAIPQARSGRGRVRFNATLKATGNAPLEATLAARDRADSLTASFAPPQLHLEPMVPATARLTARPRRPHWIGRPREHQLALTAEAAGAAPPPPQILNVRQKAWIPFWLLPLVLLIAALAAAYALTRPEKATMPPLVGETFNAAQLATARAGFTQTPEQQTRQARRRDEIGLVVNQIPAPGAEAPPDANVILVVAVGRQTTRVPDLKGMDLDAAQAALRKAKLKLGPVEGDAAKGEVSRQDPARGDRANQGEGVRLWLQVPEGEAESTVVAPIEATETDADTPSVSLDGLRRLAIADTGGIYVDTPGSDDTFRLNTTAADSDPAWLADRVVFRRLQNGAGQLFVVDADPAAEPDPLTPEGEDWTSPVATAGGTLAAVNDGRICVRVDGWKCRDAAGVSRIAWGSEGATLVALIDAKVVSFDATGDDPATWEEPAELGDAEGATEIAVSPEGVVAIASASGVAQLGGDPIAETACGIEFLDATRLAFAAGACGEDPRIRLADLETGRTRAIPGVSGEHLAFAAE